MAFKLPLINLNFHHDRDRISHFLNAYLYFMFGIFSTWDHSVSHDHSTASHHGISHFSHFVPCTVSVSSKSTTFPEPEQVLKRLKTAFPLFHLLCHSPFICHPILPIHKCKNTHLLQCLTGLRVVYWKPLGSRDTHLYRRGRGWDTVQLGEC